MVAKRLLPALLPCTWKLYEPRRSSGASVRVRVLWALLLAGGVTLPGLKPQLRPAGRPWQDSATEALKPSLDVTVQVLVALSPSQVLTVDGVHETVKSGPAWGVPLAQLLAVP